MKRKIRDLAVWFIMLCKRLLLKPSFIALLIIIPLSVVALKVCTAEGSGALKIGLYSYGSELGEEITESLLARDSIIHFESFDSEDEARNAVISGKLQAAWIFPADIEQRIKTNADNGTARPLVSVIQRESSASLGLSGEILYGALHPYVSYENYASFIEKKYGDTHSASDEEIRSHYYTAFQPDSIIEIRVLGEKQAANISTDILSFPVRGILAVLMVLCGLASAMVFKEDKRAGRFGFLSPSMQILPEFGCILAGEVLSCIPVGISLIFLELGTAFYSEVLSLVLYAFASSGFCLLCSQIFRSTARLGAVTPFIIIAMLVLCPIFIDIGIGARVIFPPSLYLYAPYNAGYLGYLAVYSIISIGLSLLIKFTLCGIFPRNSK